MNSESSVVLVVALVGLVAIASMIFAYQSNDNNLYGQAAAKAAIKQPIILPEYAVNLNSNNIKITGDIITYTVTVKGNLDDAQAEFLRQINQMGLENTPYANIPKNVTKALSSTRWKEFKQYTNVRTVQVTKKQVVAQMAAAPASQIAQLQLAAQKMDTITNNEQDLTNTDFETYYAKKYGIGKNSITGNMVADPCRGITIEGMCFSGSANFDWGQQTFTGGSVTVSGPFCNLFKFSC